MKTKLIIEVETEDNPQVWEDCEKQPEDYTEEELESYRSKYSKGLHKSVVKFIKDYFNDIFGEALMESSYMDKYILENCEDFEDCGIKIKIT